MLEIGLTSKYIKMVVARGKLNVPAGIEVIKLAPKSMITLFLTLSNVPTGIDEILLFIKLVLANSTKFESSAGNLVRSLLSASISISLVFKSCSISIIAESFKATEAQRMYKTALAAAQVHGAIEAAGGQSSAEVNVVKTT
jgi:hypothetical protein